MDTISPVYARLVLREMVINGIDTSPLFAGTSLNREDLQRGGDISIADFLQVLEIGQQSLTDAHLGLMLGRNMRVFGLGALGAGMAVAPTVRDGLQILESYTRLHTSYTSIRAHSTMNGLSIQLRYQRNMGKLEYFHTETAALLLQHYVEDMTGEPLNDAHYRMTMPPPQDLAAYKHAFHSPISFAAQHNEIELPRHWLDQPSPYFHSELWEQAQQGLSKALKALSSKETADYTHHVSALLRSSEPPLPDLGEVARNLHVSERTLNRRLQSENSSFRELKSKFLAEWAKVYLDQTDDSIESIAATLGYQDTANFRRAFRKSIGTSPGEYRLARQ